MRLLFSLAAAVLTGCHMGPKVTSYPAAAMPAGIVGVVHTRSGSYSGELLEVSDSAFVIVAKGQLTHIGYDAVAGYAFDNKHVRLAARSDFTQSRLRDLRMRSRFPYGIPGTVLQQLLAIHGQAELIRAGDK